jgi:hypothetical protein
VAPFEKIELRKESYLRSTIIGVRHTLEIFIYADGADFVIDDRKRWRGFEKEDYRSEDSLIDSFVSELKAAILTL